MRDEGVVSEMGLVGRSVGGPEGRCGFGEGEGRVLRTL